MTYKYCTVTRDGPISIVTITREEARNSLHYAAHQELEEIFDAFAADDEQWIAIITGAGDKAFSAGHDLKVEPELHRDVIPRSGFGGLTHRFDLNKPVIAAVNGAAMGGGFELALACDVIIAHERAVFALSEPRVGFAAVGGGIQRLALEIGTKRAMDMLLTGRRVGADEGLRLGFVNEVVAGNVLEAARRYAETLLECSPMALRATKEAVIKTGTIPLDQALFEEWNYPAMVAMLSSADATEGPQAFHERRAPKWRGR